MAKAKFVVRKGSAGKFRFNLVGTNGKVFGGQGVNAPRLGNTHASPRIDIGSAPG